MMRAPLASASPSVAIGFRFKHSVSDGARIPRGFLHRRTAPTPVTQRSSGNGTVRSKASPRRGSATCPTCQAPAIDPERTDRACHVAVDSLACACPYRKTGSHFSGTCAREGDMMLNGIVVLVLAIAVLAAIWALILYGSTYFGPR